MFLLAWIFLAAAIATLYAGLSEEGRGYLYLSMAASGVTVLLTLAQLRRGALTRSATRTDAPAGLGEAGDASSDGDTRAAAGRDEEGERRPD